MDDISICVGLVQVVESCERDGEEVFGSVGLRGAEKISEGAGGVDDRETMGGRKGYVFFETGHGLAV